MVIKFTYLRSANNKGFIWRIGYVFIQKLVKLLGFKIIISRVNFSANIVHQVRLHQKNIKNLKIILNRENLLKLLTKNGIIAEVGVDKGDFSAKIIFFTKPTKLYLIDTWDSERYNLNKMNYVKKRFQKEIDAGSVYIIRGTSEKEIKKFENHFFDWVYIHNSYLFSNSKRVRIMPNESQRWWNNSWS